MIVALMIVEGVTGEQLRVVESDHNQALGLGRTVVMAANFHGVEFDLACEGTSRSVRAGWSELREGGIHIISRSS